MKPTFLAITLAVASMPLMFAAQVPPANSGAAASTGSSKVQTKSIKKHKKASKKAAVKTNATAPVSK